MDQKPSIGRIVHYVLPSPAKYAGEHRPAIITRVWSDTCVNLHVFEDFDDGELESLPTSVTFEALGKAERSWHWPERVD